MSTISERVARADVADVLNLAADLIQERGHHKGWYIDPSGAVCLRGAIILAVDPYCDMSKHDPEWLIPAGARPALVRIGRHIFRTTGVLSSAEWNDRDETTPADVVAVLREAARAGT